MAELAIYFDTSKCTGCKGCQSACKCWNLLPSPLGLNVNPPTGSYQAPADLNGDTRIIMRFEEHDNDKLWGVDWAISRRSCMHCSDAGCVAVCPSGALSYDDTGFVAVDEDKCIGCRYCEAACPFDVPRYHGSRFTINKCTACLDRIKNGGYRPEVNETGETTSNEQFGIPACVHTCPPAALEFGDRDEMIAKAKARVEFLKNREISPYPEASVYGENELGGLHVIMVLRLKPEAYGLPVEPKVSDWVGALNFMKPLGGIGMAALVGGLGLSFITGLGYKRDTLRYDEVKRVIIDEDTGDIVRDINAEESGAAAESDKTVKNADGKEGDRS